MKWIRELLGMGSDKKQELVESTNQEQEAAREELRTSVERFTREIDLWSAAVTAARRRSERSHPEHR